MTDLTRRNFLETSTQAGLGLAAGGMLTLPQTAAAKAPASERVRLAMVGIRGRGPYLMRGFLERGDCEVAYLCDPDASLHDSRAEEATKLQGFRPETVQDFRKALEDDSVDAIVVATPDHWHALATVWGCQAGKHVYVEKPASQSAWEGRQMVEAARKYNRVVQLGTQNRSAPYNMAAREYITSGKLGKIHMCRVYNQKNWGNRQPRPDEAAPATMAWNLWTGPAQEVPYNQNYHNGWHHFWNFSGGDINNDASHQIDLARWLIGKDYPKSVYSVGGRFNTEGVFETPDTQVAVYEYDDLIMTFELTLYTPYMLKIDPGVRNNDLFPYWPQCATRIEIYGDKGLMVVGRHGGGWQVFDRTKGREPQVMAEMYGRFPDPEHKADFITAIKEARRPNADIEEGHRSTLLCHYANASYRLGGEKLVIDPATETCINNPQANALLKREYRKGFEVPSEV